MATSTFHVHAFAPNLVPVINVHLFCPPLIAVENGWKAEGKEERQRREGIPTSKALSRFERVSAKAQRKAGKKERKKGIIVMTEELCAVLLHLYLNLRVA